MLRDLPKIIPPASSGLELYYPKCPGSYINSLKELVGFF